MRIPGDEEILALHEKYAPTPQALDEVHTHCVIVCEVAEQLHARGGIDADIALVRAGCLLHDIGVYQLYDDAGRLDYPRYIRHGLLGYQLLREEGLPEAVCRFASHHTGTGLTRREILSRGLPLPPDDYLADSTEEALVMYADKFHTKSRPPSLLTGDAYARYVHRFGADKVAAFTAMRAEFGEPDLAPLARAFGQQVSDQA